MLLSAQIRVINMYSEWLRLSTGTDTVWSEIKIVDSATARY